MNNTPVKQTKEKLHAGIIGCGLIAGEHLKACRAAKLPVVFDAFCDAKETEAHRLADEYDGQYATTDLKRLADDPTLDVLYICTPNHVHLENLTAIAASGKAVFMEKPMVTKRKDFEAMAKIVKKFHLRFFPGLKIRFNPLLRKMRELAPNAYSVYGHVIDAPWPTGHWTSNPEQGGGHCLSQGIYAADGIRYLSGGEPVRVTAAGSARRNDGKKNIDVLSAVYEFDNGCVGTLNLADTAPAPDNGKFYFELCGKDISAAISHRFTRLAWRTTANVKDEITTDEENGLMEENKHFLESVINNKPFALTFHDGWICSEMIFAALESAAVRKPVEINPYKIKPVF
ncbi:MAG: Gfo/Idh/MocA family oxidoreductase [Lentisphaerae bacterium]|nr:Gfo/Idh/MocA family oxidoreductase [Lentisphaerota bacterium]